MTMRLTFGVDPGLTGAITTLIDGEPGPYLDMPTMDAGEGNEVDARAVVLFVREQRAAHPGAHVEAVMERIHARPMRDKDGKALEGGKARHSLAEGYGQLKAAIRVLGIPLTLVQPVAWKRSLRLLGQPKDAGRLLALARFPSARSFLSRKKDNGRADALLIALWHENTQLGSDVMGGEEAGEGASTTVDPRAHARICDPAAA